MSKFNVGDKVMYAFGNTFPPPKPIGKQMLSWLDAMTEVAKIGILTVSKVSGDVIELKECRHGFYYEDYWFELVCDMHKSDELDHMFDEISLL